ncbi:lipoprotein LppT [Mycobacterium tuberculosis]|nr:lipoprotein LppT [Mycobacterium tuberculosis]CNG37292.1 lipoprotein LppT [Mycobacterium tuberculosis]CNL64586.1 lipoprotein LppT [Mycobacterium tuberculosis]
MSVKSKNGRLAARVLVALAALFAMIALTGSACLAEGPLNRPGESGDSLI